jgi:hypothetical protein
LSADLDAKLLTMSGDIGAALVKWKVKDAIVGSKIKLPRGKFSLPQKIAIAEQHADQDDLKKDPKSGKLINLKKTRKLARRHVVSSYDISNHYVQVLNGKEKKVSQGKLLIEQRSSIGEARTQVKALTVPALQEAATERYSAFFGYLRNMFIGGSQENSALQQKLDRHHPDMEGNDKKIDEHVRHVKRAWALDSSITISGLET